MNPNVDDFLRIAWRIALLVGLVLGVMLCHDGLYGNRGQWLPYAFDSFRELGLLLVPGTIAALVLEFLRGRCNTPGGARLIVIFRWVVRSTGLLLLAIPWVVLLSLPLLRAPGVRPGNEGEGLGMSLLFLFLTPPGLGLTVFSFFIRDKPAKPEDLHNENPKA